MSHSQPLKVIGEELEYNSSRPLENTLRQARRLACARFERLWLLAPDSFDPLKNSMGEERITRTLTLISKCSPSKVCDLGCGSGSLTLKLCQMGCTVDAVDIASLALKKLASCNEPKLNLYQEFVPHTMRDDSAYDLVISTELIAELPQPLQRLFFAEISRLLAPKGCAIISTSLDLKSEDALEQFIALAQTELEIQTCIVSHHSLWLFFYALLATPRRLLRAATHQGYRKEVLAKRKGCSLWLFQLLSCPYFAIIWRVMTCISEPLFGYFVRSRSLLLILETFSRFLWQERAASHAIILALPRQWMQPK